MDVNIQIYKYNAFQTAKLRKCVFKNVERETSIRGKMSKIVPVISSETISKKRHMKVIKNC